MPAESTSTSRAARRGSVAAIRIAMRPPLECPTIVGRSIASASMKAATNAWYSATPQGCGGNCALAEAGQVERVHGGHGRKTRDDRVDGLDRCSPAVQHEHGRAGSPHQIAGAQAEHGRDLGGKVAEAA